MNYNFEYENNRKYRVPIILNLDNSEYKQETIEFLRKKYSQGLNKKLKESIEFLKENQIKEVIKKND